MIPDSSCFALLMVFSRVDLSRVHFCIVQRCCDICKAAFCLEALQERYPQ